MVLASLVLAVLLVVAFASVALSTRDLRDAADDRARADALIAEATRTEKLVLDLETGSRGFVITGKSRFLEPWRAARQSLPDAVAALMSVAADVGRREHTLAARVGRAIRSYRVEWSEALVRRALRDRAAAIRLVSSGEGKRRTDALRTQFDNLIDIADRAATARSDDAEAAARDALRLGGAGLAVSLLVMLVYALYLARLIALPVRRVAAAADRLAGGDLSARAPEQGRAELGTLGQSFNEMAAALEQRRDELEARNEALEHARRETEAASVEAHLANQAKSEFLSRMSHELRTPMNAIIGFAQLLDVDALEERQQRRVDHILKAGRHLLELINEVLDISRIEAGEMTLSPEPLHIGGLIGDVVPLVEPLAASRSITIDIELGEISQRHVLADMQRLKQVLLNLLSNAIKYNREGGRVTMAAREAENERIQISVADTGHGIARSRLEQIFEPFERLEADQTDVEGTGLGLALSKRLAEAMEGSLTVQSEPGAGSTFTVELPMSDPPMNSKGDDAAAAHAPGPFGTHTFLYIEDNLSNLRLVEEILESEPEVTLVSAMLGRLGLELAYQHRPSLVLLDLNLPDIDGRQVLRNIKNDPRTCDIPVIVLSADATPRQVRALTELGAAAYLTKPIDVQEFRHAVGSALRSRGGEC